MMKSLILKASKVKEGDLIVVPVYNDEFDRGIHCVLRVKSIDIPFEDMLEFEGSMLSHCDGEVEFNSVSVRRSRTVAVFRDE